MSMGREIKFRAWSKKLGMRQLDQITMGDKSWSCEGGNGVSLIYQSHIKVMQFTGLKDKNGKEIYEGDIVKVFEEDEIDEDHRVYPVVWGDHYPAFCLDGYEDLEYNSLQHACCVVSCEVVGNIYEHPHLLTKQ